MYSVRGLVWQHVRLASQGVGYRNTSTLAPIQCLLFQSRLAGFSGIRPGCTSRAQAPGVDQVCSLSYLKGIQSLVAGLMAACSSCFHAYIVFAWYGL